MRLKFPRAFVAHILGIALCMLSTSVARAESIVVAGDSVLAWNASSGQSVSHALSDQINAPVKRVAVAGARMLRGGLRKSIPAQLRRVSGGVVIVNGGANDLARLCGCTACDAVLDRLLTKDGERGEIASLISSLHQRNTQVIWAFYYDAPRGGGPFSPCDNEIDELESRISALAQRTKQLSTVDLARVIDPDSIGHYDRDRVHPSPLGSARIAALIAQRLQ